MSRIFLAFIFIGLCLLAAQTTLGLQSSEDDPNLFEGDRMSGLVERELNKDLELKRQQKLFEKLVAQIRENLSEKKLVSGE